MIRRVVALFLSVLLMLTGCVQPPVENLPTSSPEGSQETPQEIVVEDTPAPSADKPEYTFLDEPEVLCTVENNVYAALVDTLDPERFYVEDVTTSYVSKEYLEEIEYNSQSNVFFGYSLDDLDEQFQGTRYVFTLDDNGNTIVQPMEEIQDDTCDQVVKNVMIGGGVILVSATVAVITRNPALAPKAGKAIKIIYVASSKGAKAGMTMALAAGAMGGSAAAITEALETGEVEDTVKAGLLGASEGFKVGAIVGTVQGIFHEIQTKNNYRFFSKKTPQAKKYPIGVEFTKAMDGKEYPRFEKWAKATAKFSKPTVEAAKNHTGLSGNYYYDAKLANAQCGLTQTPAGYVWHHVEDMQTMILVPQDLHSVAMGGMSHTGGASLIKKLLATLGA